MEAKSTQIPVAEMSALIESGDATPLFPEYAVGPTWYDGSWWHVPERGDHEHYVLAPEELSAEFGNMFTRHMLMYRKLQEHMDRDGELPPDQPVFPADRS